MNKRRYPASLFFIGLITNVVFRYFWLFIPSVILIIVGIFVKPCLFIGLGVLLVDVIISVVEQLIIRRTVLCDSDNPDFASFQEIFEKDGDWKDNVGEYIEEKLENTESVVNLNDGDETKEG